MNQRIYYLGYYDTPEYADEQRNAPPAARAKMDYIVSVLNRIGYDAELVSPAATKDKRSAKARKIMLDQRNTLKLFYSPGGKSKPAALFRFLILKLSFFFYILFRVSASDTVIVYHSAEFIGTLLLLKKLRGFRLLLEVEEIYADVTGKEKIRKKEFKIFDKADAYIFSTELLAEKINLYNKPMTIIYGSYSVAQERIDRKENDGRIHCVYSGTFDTRKGVLTAVQAARYLPENYHIHIIGFGKADEIARLREAVEEVDAVSKAKLSYDGMFSGKDYVAFLSKCNIGLSPQKPNAEFNETSFPSKILSYLSNGLRVVSIRLRSLEASAIKDCISFYDEDSPRALARAVMKVDVTDGRSAIGIVKELDVQFTQQLSELLS